MFGDFAGSCLEGTVRDVASMLTKATPSGLAIRPRRIFPTLGHRLPPPTSSEGGISPTPRTKKSSPDSPGSATRKIVDRDSYSKLRFITAR